MFFHCLSLVYNFRARNMSDDTTDSSSFDLLIRAFHQADRTQFDVELNHLLDRSRTQDMSLCTRVILQAYRDNQFAFLEELLDREVIYSGIPNLTSLHAASGYALSRLVKYLLDERQRDPNLTCTFVKNDHLSGKSHGSMPNNNRIALVSSRHYAATFRMRHRTRTYRR